MSYLSAKCPRCDRQFQVPEEHQLRFGRCNYCGHHFQIPGLLPAWEQPPKEKEGMDAKELDAWFRLQIEQGVPLQQIADSIRELPTRNDYKTVMKKSKLWDRAFDKMLRKVRKAQRLEADGRYGQAIKVWEELVADRFGGRGPYDRLRILYTRRKDFESAIRVCKLCTEYSHGGLEHWIPKLEAKNEQKTRKPLRREDAERPAANAKNLRGP